MKGINQKWLAVMYSVIKIVSDAIIIAWSKDFFSVLKYVCGISNDRGNQSRPCIYLAF